MFMTTMASTSHGLSVWANTCIKSPINPRSGLNATLHDSPTSPVRCDNTLLERQDNNTQTTFPRTSMTDFQCEMWDNVYDQISKLKGQQFYEKLQELKEENSKTLQAFERLYLHKRILENLEADNLYDNDRSSFDNKDAINPLNVKASNTFDKEIKIATKPPSGKLKETLVFTPIQSETIPQRSTWSTKLGRPGSAPLERSHSLDHDNWQKTYPGSRDPSDNFIIPQEKNINKYEKAMTKVDKLWEDFKIYEHSQRRHSFSSSQQEKEDQSGRVSKTPEWRHRLTIPKPFQMSIRDALKEKKRTSAQEDLEQKRLAKQKQEEVECEKKFKAQPVPAHVYLPLFEEIMERNETRRRYVKQVCQELLQSQVKPFSFDNREKEKKMARAHSAPVRRPDWNSNGFKAKPVPKHIFSPEIDEKFLAEEELRKIRVKMRSKELLRESSLPPNMAAREFLKEQERKEKIKLAKSAAKKRHRRNTHDIPNYNALYNQFKKELEKHRLELKGTNIEPFNFETDKIHSKIDRIRADNENDDNKLRDNRWPFQSPRTRPHSSIKNVDSLDYVPAQTSRSAELRSIMTQKKKERLENHQKEEEEAEKRRRTRVAKMQRHLSQTGGVDIPKPRYSIAERLKQIRKEDSERHEAYEREIAEMNARVQKSPLLVEKYMAEYAKTTAEKKFKAALNSAGLNDSEFVSTKTSAGKSDHGTDNLDDYINDNINKTLTSSTSGNVTYTKSSFDD